ncbi:MAG: hypothetical protein Q7V15_14315, partial [Phenylobacterium sp.]|uniref:hypothetical protein n=1 Tax=Phenylobacterium sp. TaxID=1871053 RepID=UPI0027243C37
RLGQAAYAVAPALTEHSVGAVFRWLLGGAKPAPTTDGSLLVPIPEGVDTSGHWLARKKLPSAHVISGGLAAMALAGLAGLTVRQLAKRASPHDPR